MIRILGILALCWGIIDGFKFLQDEIPNGDRVPHPCKPNFIWQGVGHKSIEGGGDRNPFGKDFTLNGLVWDECICRRDSDGDGRTNGEELGDPDCVWTHGDMPAKSEDLSHPGICEPVNSPYCTGENDGDFCKYEGFDCPALHDEGVEEITLRFDKTAVPAQETSYYCMTFDLGLDPDVEYHMIGSEPLIDNKNVMHHIVIYGCPDGIDDAIRMDTPQACDMMEQGECSSIIGGWSLGFPGTCIPSQYGYKAGKGGIKSVIMQFHWNNPTKRSDYTDGSGMRLYVTRKLRPTDAAMLTVGTPSLYIPPGLKSLDQFAYCTANCTRYMPHMITLSSFSFHMHLLGKTAKLEHIRNGRVLNVLEENNFSYDSPKYSILKEPIEFHPGDELTLTCGFKSTSRSRTTYSGHGTSDEMCFVFMDYYPAVPKLIACLSYGVQDVCLMPGVTNKHGYLGNQCDLDNSTMVTSMHRTLLKQCNMTCSSSCVDTLDAMVMEHPCLGSAIQRVFELEVLAPLYGAIGRQVAEMLHICDIDWDSDYFYAKAGLIDRNQTASGGNDKPVGATTTRSPIWVIPDGCIFDLDYE